MGFGGAGFLAIAAIGHGTFVGGFSVFIAAIICASLFFDGGFAAIQSYPPELFPPSLAATGAGVSQVSSGFAKATSPVIFAAISGANTVITHTSAARSVLPGTLFIASGLLVVGLAFTFLVPSPLRRRLAAGPRVTDI
jgi:hypothetical protein